MVSVKDSKGQDSIYLIKSAHKLTLDDALAQVDKHSANHGGYLKKADFFEMPVINL